MTPLEIVGSVPHDEVPIEAVGFRSGFGMWTGLAKRCIEDHTAGQVTVIKVKDHVEYKRMRNGTAQYFRDRKFSLNTSYTENADGLTVYMELEREQPSLQVTHPRTAGRTSVGSRNNSR